MSGFTAGDARAKRAGAAGGKASGLKRKRALLRTFVERWPWMDVGLLEAIYTYGQTRYYSGVQARYRAGAGERRAERLREARRHGGAQRKRAA